MRYNKSYVALLLKGDDWKYYISYVDTKGKEVVPPTKWTEGGIATSNFYCMVNDEIVTVLKPDGTEIMTVSSNNVDYSEKDYIICNGRYYFF